MFQKRIYKCFKNEYTSDLIIDSLFLRKYSSYTVNINMNH